MNRLCSGSGKKFYIGLTSDLKRRLNEHKGGRVKGTKDRKSLRLVFYEAFLKKEDVARREKYFKTTKGKRSLRPILKKTLS